MHSEDTIIDHYRRINRVMLHINRHLDEKHRLDELAGVACLSPFHLIRVFDSVMGETPRQYIIRKRMERAGFYLLSENKPITDIALNLAYGTPSSFCKIFKAHFGISPRRFRDTTSRTEYAKPNHPFRCNRPTGSGFIPSPVIRVLPPFQAMVMENRGVVDGSFLTTASKTFDRFEKIIRNQGLEDHIDHLISIYPFRAFAPDDRRVKNLVGGIVKKKFEPVKGLFSLSLPGGRYAIFNHFGSYEFIVQTWNRAYMGWLPKSGLALRDSPPLEIHLPPGPGRARLFLKAYILIPIR